MNLGLSDAASKVIVATLIIGVTTSLGAATIISAVAVHVIGGLAVIVLVVLHSAGIVAGHLLHEVAILVVASDVDARALKLVLDVHVRREDHLARLDQTGAHVRHVGHRGGAHAEALGAQTGSGYGGALGGLLLAHLAAGCPGGGDVALRDV